MTRLVDADALIKEANADGAYGYVSAADISNAPTIDAEPVRHGRWNDGDPYCPICRKDKFRGLYADVWADWKPDYCPNCGANMRGEADE